MIADADQYSDDDVDAGPSKSEPKRQSLELQALGEALIELPQSELDALPLPEAIRDAVDIARRITKHGGLYRQKQYIGKLMRKYDVEPIRAALTARRDRTRIAAMRFRRLEQWRDRLLTEGPSAIEAVTAEAGGTLDDKRLRALIAQAATEKHTGATPKAAREIFRILRESQPD